MHLALRAFDRSGHSVNYENPLGLESVWQTVIPMTTNPRGRGLRQVEPHCCPVSLKLRWYYNHFQSGRWCTNPNSCSKAVSWVMSNYRLGSQLGSRVNRINIDIFIVRRPLQTPESPNAQAETSGNGHLQPQRDTQFATSCYAALTTTYAPALRPDIYYACMGRVISGEHVSL